MRYVKSTMSLNGADTVVCKLDYEGIDLQRNDDIAKDPDAACFLIETYKKLSTENPIPGEDPWDAAFGPVNMILSVMEEKDQRAFVNFFIDAKVLINSSFVETSEQLDRLTKKLESSFYYLDREIKLREYLNTFVKAGHIVFPDLSNIGARAHDKPEFTFGYDEYIYLTEISLVCKMLAPLWGEIIYRTKHITNTNFKETQCCTIMYSYLMSYGSLIDKFTNYIYNSVKEPKSVNESGDVTRGFNGYTSNNTVLYVFGTMCVKKFVNIDLRKDICNIMTYVNTCTKMTTQTQRVNMQGKNRASLRHDYTKDDGNSSALENVSFSTRYTADIPGIVEHALDQTIAKLLVSHKLSKSTYETMLKFYRRNPISLTSLNHYIVATTFGHSIGGGGGFRLLNATAYSKAIAFIQLMMVSKGYPSELAHLLSIVETQTEQSGDNNRINVGMRFNMTSSEEYRNCKNMFTQKIGTIQWDSCIVDIINTITTYESYHSSPPVLWLAYDEEDRNGTLAQYSEHLVRHICSYILFVVRELMPVRYGD